MRAVSNAGPLIHLSWIDQLDLLDRLFEEVFVPGAVADEVLQAPAGVPGTAGIRAALGGKRIQVRSINDQARVTTLMGVLHRGEAEAIVLIAEEGADLLLLDDSKARDTARRLGIPITGTIGLLREAKLRGLVPAIIPLVLELRRLGFWVSVELLERIRREETDAHEV